MDPSLHCQWFQSLMCHRDFIILTPSLTTHGPLRQQYRDYVTFGTWCDCWWTRQHRWDKVNVNAPKRGGQMTPFPWIVAKRIATKIIAGIYMHFGNIRSHHDDRIDTGEYHCEIEIFDGKLSIEMNIGLNDLSSPGKHQVESSNASLWAWSKVAFTAWKFFVIPLAMWNWFIDIFRVYGLPILNKNYCSRYTNNKHQITIIIQYVPFLLPEALLAYGYSHCLRLCVCVSVCLCVNFCLSGR